LRDGADPTDETAKLYVTWKTLAVRADHAAAFAGSYEPIELGPGVCAFTRGAEVLVAVGTGPNVELEAPPGWRDVLGLSGLVLAVPG